MKFWAGADLAWPSSWEPARWKWPRGQQGYTGILNGAGREVYSKFLSLLDKESILDLLEAWMGRILLQECLGIFFCLFLEKGTRFLMSVWNQTPLKMGALV